MQEFSVGELYSKSIRFFKRAMLDMKKGSILQYIGFLLAICPLIGNIILKPHTTNLYIAIPLFICALLFLLFGARIKQKEKQ